MSALAALVEPAEPFVLVLAGPDRLVALPQPADLGGSPPFLGALGYGLAEPVAERELLSVDGRSEHGGAFVGDGAIELVGGIRELLDAVLDQLGR